MREPRDADIDLAARRLIEDGVCACIRELARKLVPFPAKSNQQGIPKSYGDGAGVVGGRIRALGRTARNTSLYTFAYQCDSSIL